jgi:hypothetical protein
MDTLLLLLDLILVCCSLRDRPPTDLNVWSGVGHRGILQNFYILYR